MSKVLQQIKMTGRGRFLVTLCCIVSMMILAGLPAALHADRTQYVDDDLWRLSQVIDGQGNLATYTYDAVGNLHSITRGTGGGRRHHERRLNKGGFA